MRSEEKHKARSVDGRSVIVAGPCSIFLDSLTQAWSAYHIAMQIAVWRDQCDIFEVGGGDKYNTDL